jgi:hypothetical protein
MQLLSPAIHRSALAPATMSKTSCVAVSLRLAVKARGNQIQGANARGRIIFQAQ